MIATTSCVERWTPASSEAVWMILADGWTYAAWVVGTIRVRAVDTTFPEPGTVVDSDIGAWPLAVADRVEVELCRPREELVLRADAGLLGSSRVRLTIFADRGGTVVKLDESPVKGPGTVTPQALLSPLLRARNAEALRRLTWLAEGRDTAGR